MIYYKILSRSQLSEDKTFGDFFNNFINSININEQDKI